MFWNRWSVAWLGVWLVGASIWGMFLITVVMTRWPAVPPHWIRGNVIDLPLFFLTWFTLPAFSIYIGGLLAGWMVVRVSRWPVWSRRWWTLAARTDVTTLLRSLRHRLSSQRRNVGVRSSLG